MRRWGWVAVMTAALLMAGCEATSVEVSILPPEEMVEASWGPDVLPDCVALVPRVCEDRLIEARLMMIRAGRTITAVRIVCTKPPCSPTSGDGTTTLTLDDGSTQDSSWSYRP